MVESDIKGVGATTRGSLEQLVLSFVLVFVSMVLFSSIPSSKSESKEFIVVLPGLLCLRLSGLF